MSSTPPSFATITRIEIDYDGSGDSGGINTITAFTDDTVEVDLSAPQKRWIKDRVLDVLPMGFEDNEGGFGTVVISPPENTLLLYHNAREWEDQESPHVLTRAQAGAVRSRIPRTLRRRWRKQGVIELRVQLFAEDLHAEVLFLDRDGRVVEVSEADSVPDTVVEAWYEHLKSEFPLDEMEYDDADISMLCWTFCLGLDCRRHSPLRSADQSPWGVMDLSWSEIDSVSLPRFSTTFLPTDDNGGIASSTPDAQRATA